MVLSSLQNGPTHHVVASVSVLSSDWTFGVLVNRCNQISSQVLTCTFGPGLLLQRYDGAPFLLQPSLSLASLLIWPASYNQAKKLWPLPSDEPPRLMRRARGGTIARHQGNIGINQDKGGITVSTDSCLRSKLSTTCYVDSSRPHRDSRVVESKAGEKKFHSRKPSRN